MATIKLRRGTGAPGASALAQYEVAMDVGAKTIYTSSDGATSTTLANYYDDADVTSHINTLSVDTHSDVTLTTPSTDQLLAYNGSAWVNTSEIKPGQITQQPYSLPPWRRFGAGAYIQNFTQNDFMANGIASNTWRRSAALSVVQVAAYGTFYDTTNLTPSNWEGKGPYVPYLVADQNSVYDLGDIRAKLNDVAVDGSGNLDAFNGSIQFSVVNKTAASYTANTYQALEVKSDRVTFYVQDSSTANQWVFQVSSLGDEMKFFTDADTVVFDSPIRSLSHLRLGNATVGTTAPGSPVENEPWIDTTTTATLKVWDGSTWTTPTPQKGMTVFDSTNNRITYYDGTNWAYITASGTL